MLNLLCQLLQTVLLLGRRKTSLVDQLLKPVPKQSGVSQGKDDQSLAEIILSLISNAVMHYDWW
jgi:hypothetical protein